MSAQSSAKAQYAAFGAGFMALFLVLFLVVQPPWWVFTAVAVAALPANIALHRRAKAEATG